MVASQETLDALEDVGLNMYERKVYAALISRGVSTAGELSEMTGVPRSRSYDVLESLAEKGFAILKPSKPMQYVAVPPEEALENTKELHKKDLQEKIDRIERFKNSSAVDELQNLYDEGVSLVDPAEMSGAIKGKYNVHKRMGNMIKNADSEIKIMTSANGLKELRENHMDIIKQASELGVKVRIVAPKNESNREHFDELSKFADVRTHREDEHVPNGRFVISDDSSVSFSLTHDEIHPTQDTMFWSNSGHAASETLGPLFEMVWKNGEPHN